MTTMESALVPIPLSRFYISFFFRLLEWKTPKSNFRGAHMNTLVTLKICGGWTSGKINHPIACFL